MNSLKALKEIAAIHDAALEDLMATSDVQLMREAIEDGDDVKEIATEVRGAMREAAAMVLRQRLAQARTEIQAKATRESSSISYPALDQMKRMIKELFQSNQKLGLAFREGKAQSEADWKSLYDDLVKLGVIKRNDDGN